MKYFGLIICLAIIAGAVVQVGPHLYNDFMSATFVFGGALGFALLKNEPRDAKNLVPACLFRRLEHWSADRHFRQCLWRSGTALPPWGRGRRRCHCSMYVVKLVCMAIADLKQASKTGSRCNVRPQPDCRASLVAGDDWKATSGEGRMAKSSALMSYNVFTLTRR